MQDERRKREVVDPVHPGGDLDLLPVVGVDFDQHLDAQRPGPSGKSTDERVGLRHHEAGPAGLLHRVPGRVEADDAHVGGGQRAQDPLQIRSPLRVMDVDVDLLRGEGRPEDAPLPGPQRGHREGKAGPRPVDLQEILLGRAFREHRIQGEEQPRELGTAAAGREVLILGRVRRDVVHDHVGHHVEVRAQRPDVVPAAQPGIDSRVVDGVEARVRAVDGKEERQEVDAAENPRQRAAQQIAELAKPAAAQAIDVGDELDLVAHDGSPGLRPSWAPRPGAPAGRRAWRRRRTGGGPPPGG